MNNDINGVIVETFSVQRDVFGAVHEIELCPGGKGKDPDMFSGRVVDSDGRAVPFAKISILPVGEWEEAKRR